MGQLNNGYSGLLTVCTKDTGHPNLLTNNTFHCICFIPSAPRGEIGVQYFYLYKILANAFPALREGSLCFDFNIHTTWQIQFAQGINCTATAGVNI